MSPFQGWLHALPESRGLRPWLLTAAPAGADVPIVFRIWLPKRIPILFLAWQAIAPAGAAVNSQGDQFSSNRYSPLALMKTTCSPVKGDTFSLNPTGTSHQIRFRAADHLLTILRAEDNVEMQRRE